MSGQQPMLAAEDHQNITPDIDTDQTVDDSDGSMRFPIPSISKRQLAILTGILLVAYLAWKLRQSRASESDEDTSQSQQADPETEIEVVQDQTDPLKADESVVEGMKDSGRLDADEA